MEKEEVFREREQICEVCRRKFIPVRHSRNPKYCGKTCYLKSQSLLKSEKWRNDEEFRSKTQERSRQWYLKHRKKILVRRRDYYYEKDLRNNRLSLNGKTVKVKKRQFYGICELCGPVIVVLSF